MKTKTMTEMTDQELLDILEESTGIQEKILAAAAKADAERGIKGAWVNGLPQKIAASSEMSQAEEKRKARKTAQRQESPQAKLIRVTRKWVSDNGFQHAIDDESVVALVTWTLQTEEDPKKAQQIVFKQLTALVDKKRRR